MDIEDKPKSLGGRGMKVIILSSMVDKRTRFEILLGLKLCGHAETLTEASNLLDEI